jgi:transcriptional regulator with XRE-family HTH domain
MQEKSVEKCAVAERLQKLRLRDQLTWEQVAARLDITPSMVYQVRSGKRSLGDKTLYRLQQAEAEMWIPVDASASGNAASELMAIRKRLELTQDEMAALLGFGLNGRRISEMESGRQPVTNLILTKAEQVEHRLGGIDIALKQGLESHPTKREPVAYLHYFLDSISGLSTDDLLTAQDYFAEIGNKAPHFAQPIFKCALLALRVEVARRLDRKSRARKGI